VRRYGPGDVVEVVAVVSRVGAVAASIDCRLVVVCRGRPTSAERGEVLDPPIVAVTATGTVVVPG
jgi:3-aminobutyryl-CoA ammonia-lyase